jgi:hypothetical protein
MLGQVLPSYNSFLSAAPQELIFSRFHLGPVGSTGTVLSFANVTGNAQFQNRLLGKQGAAVASANNLTLGNDGNDFEITGATQINTIATTGWTNGSPIALFFASNPVVAHNQAAGAGFAPILLDGGTLNMTAGDTLSLKLSTIGGVQAWRFISKGVI